MNQVAASVSASGIDPLAAMGLPDHTAERRFDRVARLVAAALRVPVAVLSVAESSAAGAPARDKTGPDQRTAALSQSLRRFIADHEAPETVPESQVQAPAPGPAAVRAPAVSAYLGVKLHDSGGATRGALCAIDRLPRAWADSDVALLQDAAMLVQREMDDRQALDAARQSGESLSLLLNTLPNMVWVADATGQIEGFNDCWHAFTGSRSADDDGAAGDWIAYCHPDDRATARAAWQASLRDGCPGEMEFRLSRGDGSHGWVLARMTPVRDAAGGIAQWIGSCTDIAALKSAQAARIQVQGDFIDSLMEQIKERAVYGSDKEFCQARQLVTDLKKLREQFV